MKSKKPSVVELEAELVRLNELVRARRHQLARLDECPNKDCECRAVWHEVVDQKLKHQVGRIRKGVRTAAKRKTTRKAKRA